MYKSSIRSMATKTAYALLLLPLLASLAHAAPKSGVPCSLGKLHVAQLLTDDDTVDANQRYQLVLDGKVSPAFAEQSFADDTLTEVKTAQCQYRSQVFAVDFGSPYYKGFAIRYNARAKAMERIDFAEKALPAYLVNAADNFTVVMPNEEAGVTSKYIAYSYNGQAPAQSEKQYLDALPPHAKALR